jgi:titin
MAQRKCLPSTHGLSARRVRPRLEGLEDRLLPTTYPVTNVNDSGSGSLRQAILDSNANPGFNTITFAIGSGVQVLQPLTVLPTITNPVLLDGSTQPGFTGTPLVVLDGTREGQNTSAKGLVITAGGSTVQDLAIDNFFNAGILLQHSGSNLISDNYIGTDPSGTQADGNGYGVWIDSEDTHNVISGNVLADNGDGLEMRGRLNRVVGNRIGTDAAGTQALGNRWGVYFLSGTVGQDTIGGTTPADRNLISGNGIGVYLGGQSDLIEGNYIGTDLTGTLALGNGSGVYTAGGASGNTIGGTAAGAGNVIAGNVDGLDFYGGGLVEGNLIGLNAAGTAALPNGTGVYVPSAATIGGSVPGAGNVISGNLHDGVLFMGPTGLNVVQGNRIGTNPSGTAAIPNGDNGIEISGGAGSDTIGGTAPGAGNLISGNGLDGLALASSDRNLIQGNTIGTTADLSAALPNGYGIALGNNNTVGGSSILARNIIAGNRSDGIFLGIAADSNLIQNNAIAANSGYGINISATASDNVLLGNAIGTTPGGGLAYPNGQGGVALFGSLNTLGGTTAGAGNLISGNTADGVVLAGSFNLVQGNTLGANASHTAALPNRAGLVVSGTNNTIGGTAAGAGNFIAGNAADGLDLSGGSNLVQGNILAANGATGLTVTSAGNTLGGTAAGAGNIVVLNALDGVRLSGSGASGNRVQGNFLGTGPNGTSALGNGGNGVAVVGASGNTIGGTTAGAGNTIAFNGNDGALVDTGSGNAIQQNSIYSSGNLGIVLLNGGNNGQAAPVLTAVTSDDSSTTIAGTLSSAPNTTLTVEFYANDVCNPSGYGEGQTFLGAATVTTDDNGAATFTVTLDGGVAAGQYVSATATDPAGNTSAFAACWQLPAPTFPALPPLQTAGLSAPLSPTSGAAVSTAAHLGDAPFRNLAPEAGRPPQPAGGSFVEASVHAAAPPVGAGDSSDGLGDLLATPGWSDLR